MTTLTVDAKNDADEARQSARVAMEIAQRYSSPPSKSHRDKATRGITSESALKSACRHKDQKTDISANMKIPPSSQKPLAQDARPAKQESPPPPNNSTSNSQEEDIDALTLELKKCQQSILSISQALEKERVLTSQLQASMNKKDAFLCDVQNRVTIAEEDANMAYELAQSSNDKREEVESYLRQALDEITSLKTAMATNRNERPTAPVASIGPEEGEASSVTSSIIEISKRKRSAVAMGRGVLQTYRRNGLHMRLKEVMEKHDVHSQQKNKLTVFEKRRNGCHRSIGEQQCQALLQLLSESGERLDLKLKGEINDEGDLEGMTVAYCQAVEKRFQQQNQQKKELESYCDYLERKL
eukprot:CAMPEP_0172505438 /NCGR_PEP_ID=MMETSP1066-20121228/186505_1 /TAXON_ID=671091 /ORGANISM="Coscinodiscus wailesii, Strain CCMP2513" /LENGTH=355 /DNA_ID=CAMNT_0013282045 /DNA_START=136 /DNA_END=1203 /DNA_ORIENTATION=+